jgi:hypothetical protein
MPAYTADQLRPILGSYIEPSGDFYAALAQVLPRLYALGMWRDLVYQISMVSENGIVTLPEGSESIISCTIDDKPQPVRSLWHDIRIVGRQAETSAYFGMVDDGLHATFRLLPDNLTTLYVVPSTENVTGSAFSPASGESITIRASNGIQMYQVTATSGSPNFTFPAAITFIESITYDGLTEKFDIRSASATVNTTLATVGYGNGSTRYRRFRVGDPSLPAVTAHMLVKRACPAILNGNTIIHLTNINALKHGLLGRIAEDGADIERANYHWQICTQLLDSELDAFRGAAKPMLQINPYGESGPPINML